MWVPNPTSIIKEAKMQINSKYFSMLNKNEGFFIINLNNSELNIIRNFIEQQWIKKINDFDPKLSNIFKKNTIINYHKNSDKLKHAQLWPKVSRILPAENVEKITTLPFFNFLENIFGPIQISNEENICFEEMYWRLVRPNKKEDISTLHADRWFWDLSKDYTPKNKERVKVWIPLYCQKFNGLQFVPFSQLKKYNYNSVQKETKRKPVFDNSKYKLKPVSAESLPKTALVFHDNMLHSGVINRSDQTRISLEFTMFVNPTNKNYI